MKKILKIVGAIVALLLVLMIVLPYAFKDKIEAVIKSEGNKMLNAKFDFESLDISLLRDFPSASVSLNGFYLAGVDEFAQDTLLQAGELAVSVNLMSIFGDEGFEIKKVVVDDTRLHAIVLESGAANWNIMKPDTATVAADTVAVETAGESAFRMKLQKLSVDNLTVIYDDRASGMYAAVASLDASCSGDFGSSNTTLELEAETPSVTFSMGGVPFLSKAEVALNMNIAADLDNMKFTLQQNTLSLNAIEASVDGWVAMDGEAVNMDLTLNSNKVGFKDILSMVPAIYATEFSGLKTTGNVSLSAWVKGSLEGENIPAFDLRLNVDDASFKYPSLPAGVDNINIVATVNNPGGAVDATVVNINSFRFSLAGNNFGVTAKVNNPVSDLAFSATADGTLDLGKIKEVYPLENMTLNGILTADMQLSGRMSYIEKEAYDKLQASGSLKLKDMKLAVEGIPQVEIEKSTFTFSPSMLNLSETTLNIGDNDLTVNSKFTNYLAFVLKGETLKGELNVSSRHMNLNDFMSESGDSTAVADAATDSAAPDTASMGKLDIPANIDFRATVRMNEVLMNKMSFKNVNGLLVVADRCVNMKNLSLETMGGSVTVNGSYSTPEQADARLDASFSLDSLQFARVYNDLDVVRSLAPIFASVKGSFSGSMKINTLLDDTMSPILPSLSGSGRLATKNISLKDVKVLGQVAKITNKSSLLEQNVKDLSLEFVIADGRVTTKPFNVKLGDVTMNLSGSTGLDKSIDYTGEITLPASLGNVSQLGTVDMSITGTFSSPKVSIDMASMAKKAAGNVVESLTEKLADKLLGGSSSGSSDSTSTTKSTTDKAVDAVNKVFNLFKK